MDNRRLKVSNAGATSSRKGSLHTVDDFLLQDAAEAGIGRSREILGHLESAAWRLQMRYLVAWMLGVPLSVIVLWYVVGHAACGR